MPRADADRSGDLALTATVLTWASAFPAIRVGLDGYAPSSLGLLRLLVAALALAAVSLARPAAVPARRHWVRLVVCGLLGQTLYQGLLMAGEVAVPAGTASLLIATAPMFSVIAAALLLGEPVGRRWRGMVVAFLGAALVAASLGVGGGAAALLVLAAAVCQGLYHVAVKPLAEQLGAFAATAWSLWAGTVLALPALPLLVADARGASVGSTAAAVFLGLVPSALGYATWSAAVARTSIARSTVALYLVPVAAMGLAWLWLGEEPTVVAVLGGSVAVLGVVMVRREPLPRPPRTPGTPVATRPAPAQTGDGRAVPGQSSAPPSPVRPAGRT